MSTLFESASAPTIRRTDRVGDSPTHRVGRLAARIAVILLAAGVVVAGATAIGYSPLGSRVPGTFLPFAGDHGGPPPGVTQPGPGRGAPGVRGGGSPAGANQQAGPRGAGQNGSVAGLFTGRNMPSLQSGLRQELPYLALFAVLTAAVALVLRQRRPRRTRSAGLRLSPSA